MAYAFNDDKSKVDIQIVDATLSANSTGAIAANSTKSLYFFLPSGYTDRDIAKKMIGIRQIYLRDNSAQAQPITLVTGNWYFGQQQYEGELRAYILLRVYNPSNSATPALTTNSRISITMIG